MDTTLTFNGGSGFITLPDDVSWTFSTEDWSIDSAPTTTSAGTYYEDQNNGIYKKIFCPKCHSEEFSVCKEDEYKNICKYLVLRCEKCKVAFKAADHKIIEEWDNGDL